MEVIIVVLPACQAVAVTGLYEVLLRGARRHAALFPQDGRTLRVRLMSTTARRDVIAGSGLPIRCHCTLTETAAADLVIVPGVAAPPLDDSTGPLTDWLRAVYAGGATLAACCTGTFFLAATGLLDGRRAAVSWFAAARLRRRYSAVRVAEAALLVDEGRLVTAGASTSFLRLGIFFIDRLLSAEAAAHTAKVLLVDRGEDTQRPYGIFDGYRDHGDAAILQAQRYIERHAGTALTVERVMGEVLLSKRSFVRRFKAATGMPPQEYLQRTRIERAKHALETTDAPVKAIGYAGGYTDLSYFRQLFRRYTDLSPAAYRARFAVRRQPDKKQVEP